MEDQGQLQTVCQTEMMEEPEELSQSMLLFAGMVKIKPRFPDGDGRAGFRVSTDLFSVFPRRIDASRGMYADGLPYAERGFGGESELIFDLIKAQTKEDK